MITLVLSVAVSAETFLPDTKITAPEMSDMMPSGTNIPDSNIGGAVEETSPIENMLPDNTEGAVPYSGMIGERGTDAPTEVENTLSRVLGIVIAVIVVLAVILLIVTLIPRRAYDSKNRED